VFNGESPQFHIHDVESARRWLREKSEFTHFVRYLPALEQPFVSPAPLTSCWVCGQCVSAKRPGYWQQDKMRPVHVDCHEQAQQAGKPARKRARKK
jgi:hypothetical protein